MPCLFRSVNGFGFSTSVMAFALIALIFVGPATFAEQHSAGLQNGSASDFQGGDEESKGPRINSTRTEMVLTFRVRPLSSTFVSEPDPRFFGNAANPVPPPTSWSALSTNWLRSRFHFSFAEWADGPRNFGVLRVLNDDLVQPHRMFGPHPHSDMEIATYVVSGKLTHWHMDGNGGGAHETLCRGSLQFMTAGTGITHTEGNDADEPLRFIQMWMVPRQRGLKPNYGSVSGAKRRNSRQNKWDHVLGPAADVQGAHEEEGVPCRVNQDVNVLVGEIDESAEGFDRGLTFVLEQGRQAYVVNLEGPVEVTAVNCVDCPRAVLATSEAGTLIGPQVITFSPLAGLENKAGSHLLIVEMAAP